MKWTGLTGFKKTENIEPFIPASAFRLNPVNPVNPVYSVFKNLNRLALVTTVTDDMAMAAPAITGLSNSPIKG
jgi:hypothetical protein